MNDYVIMSDSSCDLEAGMAKELELITPPLHVLIGGETFKNYLDWREISPEDFYGRLRAGQMGKTSAVNVSEFEEEMRAVCAKGLDILCLSFSSGLSTTYQSACIAAETIRREFPERTIEVVDTLCAALGQGLILKLCVDQKRAGKSLIEVRDYCENNKLRINSWITVDSLDTLKRGGRISPTAAFFGTMLSIKPVIHVDDEGKLIPMMKIRGRKQALTALAEKFAAVYDPACPEAWISHGDSIEDVKFLESEITRLTGVDKFVVNLLGPVIGSHTGPGLIALFFLGRAGMGR